MRFLVTLIVLAASAATLLLSGCKDSVVNTEAAKAAPTAVSTAAIAAEAKGFVVGSAMSARTVYVFFDAQCQHCTALWEAAKPLKPQASFVWIPVGLLNPTSTIQGATLLAAKDPVAAMNEHEISMKAQGGGISAGTDINTQKTAVANNTALLTRLGFASIPTIIGHHAETGVLVTQEGAMPTAALATLLGLRVPAQ